jgi:predicted aspartyl protease
MCSNKKEVNMKKVLHVLCVLMAAGLLVSCVSTKANDEKRKSATNEEFLAQEQVVEASTLEYKQGKNKKKFSLTIEDGTPVISFQVDGGMVRFLVDTGAPSSKIKRTGLKKAAGTAFYTIEKQLVAKYRTAIIENYGQDKASLSDDEVKDILYNEEKRLNEHIYILPQLTLTLDGSYTAVVTIYPDNSINGNIDGILGQDFLEQYKNVSFDYKNNYLVFNDNKISEHEIPLYTVHLVDSDQTANYYAVDAIINGEKESCMIDTGLNSFTMRRDFQKDKSENYDEMFSGKYDTVTGVMDTVVLSNITYKKITAFYVTDSSVGFSVDDTLHTDVTLNALIYQTDIGYPLFKDHIIQLDFENHVFRIR